MRRNFVRSVILIFTFMILNLRPVTHAQDIVIKIGTVAPTSSIWVSLWEETCKKISSRTNVKFTIYAGGIMGDEEEIIRKIKIGQLHGGIFTINGLKRIAPELAVLDVPFLFKDYREVDHVTKRFKDEFSFYFERGGFKLLVFSEQGFVYYYSKNPNVTGYRDLGRTRVWAWKGDRIMMSNASKIFGTSPIYIGVPDVLSALETGMIETIQTSPVACLSLQWCRVVKAIIDYPYRYEPGVIVIYKKFWDGLPEKARRIIESTIGEDEPRYNLLIREEQEKAKRKIETLGVRFVRPSDEDINWFENEAKRKLWYASDTEYPHDLLRRISHEVEKYRKERLN